MNQLLLLITYHQSVVCPLNTLRQQLRISFVLHIMCDVGKESALRFQFFDILECAIQPEMCLMRANAQAIKHQHLQAAQAFDGAGRHLAQVRRVREIVETISHYRQAPVNHFQWCDFKIRAETKRSSIYNCVWHNLRQASAKVRRFKDILKNPANILPGAFIRIKTERAMTKIQRTNIVEAENMISVTVSDEDCVEVPQANSQSLLPKIAGGVDNDRLPGVLD